MKSISVYFDLRKVAGFQQKNADISRIQEMCYVIYLFFEFFGARCNCAKFHHCKEKARKGPS